MRVCLWRGRREQASSLPTASPARCCRQRAHAHSNAGTHMCNKPAHGTRPSTHPPTHPTIPPHPTHPPTHPHPHLRVLAVVDGEARVPRLDDALQELLVDHSLARHHEHLKIQWENERGVCGGRAACACVRAGVRVQVPSLGAMNTCAGSVPALRSPTITFSMGVIAACAVLVAMSSAPCTRVCVRECARVLGGGGLGQARARARPSESTARQAKSAGERRACVGESTGRTAQHSHHARTWMTCTSSAVSADTEPSS